jgi:hypothetical protein
MILQVPSKVTVLQMFSVHPLTYSLATLASKRSSRKTRPSPEFNDMSAK